MEDPAVPAEPSHSDEPHRMPGWVRAIVLVGILAVAIVVLVTTLGGGGHGPSRHLPGGEDERDEAVDGDGR